MNNQFIIETADGIKHPFNFTNNIPLLTAEILTKFKDNAKKLVIPFDTPANVKSDLRKMQSGLFKHLVISEDSTINWVSGRTIGNDSGNIRNVLNGISEDDFAVLDAMVTEYKKMQDDINAVITKNLKKDAKCKLNSYFSWKWLLSADISL